MLTEMLSRSMYIFLNCFVLRWDNIFMIAENKQK